jgi:hypothetical protein
VKSTSDQPVYENVLLIALVAGLGGLFIIVAAILAIVFIKRRRGGNDIKLVEPDYAAFAFSEDKSPLYGKTNKDSFEKLLSDAKFVQCLASVTNASESNDFAKYAVYIHATQGSALKLVLDFIDHEIATSDELTIFRANSIACKIFKAYSRLIGLRYIWKMFAGPLAHLQKESNESEMEVDPERIEEGADEMANKWQLMLTAQKIFTAIERSLEYIPIELSMICHHLKEKVKAKFPGHEHKALGVFMFTRLYVPALASPVVYGLMDEPPSAGVGRQLILLSKIISNLANRVEFGREKFMEKMNDFIRDNKDKLDKFYEAISQPPKEEANDSIIEMPKTARDNAYGFFHNFLSDYQTEISKQLSSEEESWAKKTREKFEKTMESVGTPPERIITKG